MASFWTGFAWMNHHRFSVLTIRHYIAKIAHWSRYLEHQGFLETDRLNATTINDFLENHLSVCLNKHGHPQRKDLVSFSIHRFLSYLEEIDCPLLPPQEVMPHQELVDGYIRWLRDDQDLSVGTLNLRRNYLTRFIDAELSNQKDLKSLSGVQVESLFLNYARGRGPSARRSMQATLRTFFRFCLAEGHLSQDLSLFIPTLRTYRLSRVPRGLGPSDGEKLIQSIKTKSKAGIRDRAMILMLHTYGVRGVHVRCLRLEDIDWRKELICFRPAKKGKEVRLPLTPRVAESLLRYLEQARPDSQSPVIFLTAHAPYRPLEHYNLTQIIRDHSLKAGLDIPSRGSHIFRHGFATRTLAQGESLKTIADLLGHRHLSTTFQYTKVDFQALDRVALPWPEVLS
ncbi:MAG: tyrosine-type recombinase/integrase [Gammaproteobacteria bacterium]|nr:tyrosine-type recombinase/integrase [Gammaproteobacteria bacterium]